MAGIPQVITEDRASGAQVVEGSLKFDSGKSTYLQRTQSGGCLLYTSPSPRDNRVSRMPSSA